MVYLHLPSVDSAVREEEEHRGPDYGSEDKIHRHHVPEDMPLLVSRARHDIFLHPLRRYSSGGEQGFMGNSK